MTFPSLALPLLGAWLLAHPAVAGETPAPEPPPDSTLHDGSRDFDFELGDWTTHVRRLRNPLSGSTDWVEYHGTTKVLPVLGGRANLAELEVSGPAGTIRGAALRLYEPDTRRWTIHYFSAADGRLTPAVAGGFESGRGLFVGDDTLGDRAISVRFEITAIDADTLRFEQAYSADGGKTWELNWVATDTRR